MPPVDGAPPATIQPPKSSAVAPPPVTISSQAYLDPASYVKGSYLLTIEAGTVIHPRCRLHTDQGKITIHTGSILTERCIIGFDKDLNPNSHPIPNPNSHPDHTTSTDPDSKSIAIGPYSYLHSSVKIQPPALLSAHTVIEAGATLLSNCIIGAHSKVCAGITLPPNTSIPEWTVVYGRNGQMRRRRIPNDAEEVRGESMKREGKGMDGLLRAAATRGLAATTTAAAGGGGGIGSGSGIPGSKSKRESVMRT